jgi:hypothetical protein
MKTFSEAVFIKYRMAPDVNAGFIPALRRAWADFGWQSCNLW